MEIILLEKIAKLGNLGDKLNVKGGYARNYLLPQGKATMATAENTAAFEARRAELEKASQEKRSLAEARRDQLADKVIEIEAVTGEEGKLFGSIGTMDIAEAINKMGVSVVKSEVKLPNGTIRQTGEYPIQIQLHTDIEALITVRVIPS